MRAGLVQLSVGDDPVDNLCVTLSWIRKAANGGAGFVLTPECTNAISTDRSHQRNVFHHEEDDLTLATLRKEAAELKIWLLIGSLGLLTKDHKSRFANRSFLISPQGEIVARYDKIHMFDATLSQREVFKESAAYRPGTCAVLARTPFGHIGCSICYDLRFPQLYRCLAQAGAQILTVPAAFHYITGKTHWEALLKARAIETGCYVLAPAQTGFHFEKNNNRSAQKIVRQSYGHSLVVSPWGDVLVDAGTEIGVSFADLKMEEVAAARERINTLTQDRRFSGP